MRILGAALLILLAVGCNFREPKHDSGGDVIQVGVPPTFAILKKVIFEPRCVKCHSSTGKADKVPFETIQDFLVGVRPLVIPRDPLHSPLYLAITRTDEDRMPPPKKGDPLSAEEVDYIRLWIENGAPATALDAASY
jgi:hypothetical protein